MKKKQKLQILAFITMLLLLIIGMCLGIAYCVEPKVSICISILVLGLTMIWIFSIGLFTVMNEVKK